MKITNVFIDTSTVNRIKDLDVKKNNIKYEEDRQYLSKIMQEYVVQNLVEFFVNPSIKHEIDNTSDANTRKDLVEVFNKFHYTEYNKTIYPFHFPAWYVTEEEKLVLDELKVKIKNFEKDAKPFLDAISNSQVNILLTTDRKHLACVELRGYLTQNNLETSIQIFTPKEFYEYLQTVQDP
jgi:predicted nucleic acid-binding protein